MSVTGRIAAVAAAVLAVVGALVWAVPADSARPSAVADGAALFAAKGCATCHSGPATTSPMGSNFPDLRNAAEWAGDRKDGYDAAEYLTESIREPAAFISPEFVAGGGPTTAMPALMVSDAEVAALVDHLLSDR